MNTIDKIFAYFLSPEGLFLSGCGFSMLFHKALGATASSVFLLCLIYWTAFFSFRVFLKPLIKKMFAYFLNQNAI